MKVKGFVLGIILSLLSSCGNQQTSSTDKMRPTVQEANTPVVSFDDEKVFSLQNARKRVDALGIDDPRLKEHLLNVAIYAAYKAGKTDMIPTVYPIEEEGEFKAKSINK